MFPLRNIKRFFYKAIKQPVYALRVFFKRSQAQFSYSFAYGKSNYPEAITLFLTHRCNLHCKMCGQWGEGGVTKKQSVEYVHSELSLAELKSLVDDLSFFKPNITLFGGEPLLYPESPELISYIKKKKMHILMITNGSLLEVRAKEIIDSGLDELNVSLDGASQLHDSIRGMTGLYNTIVSGLKKIDSLKKQKQVKKPFINLQCTINMDNYRFLEEMLGVAGEVNADSLTFHNLIFINRQILDKQKEYDQILDCGSLNWEGFVFDPGIEPEVLNDIKNRILKGRYKFSVDFYPNFSDQALKSYYLDPYNIPKGYPARCMSPWIVAYIFPDGEVRPCLNFGYSYGNIKNDKFTKLWNDEQAVKFRKTLKTNKTFAVCGRCTELYRY